MNKLFSDVQACLRTMSCVAETMKAISTLLRSNPSVKDVAFETSILQSDRGLVMSCYADAELLENICSICFWVGWEVWQDQWIVDVALLLTDKDGQVRLPPQFCISPTTPDELFTKTGEGISDLLHYADSVEFKALLVSKTGASTKQG